MTEPAKKPTLPPSPFPQNKDDALQLMVVIQVLESHPNRLTSEELRQRIGQSDAKGVVERAVSALAKDGVLDLDLDKAILPTRPVLRINELWDGLWKIL